jgi:hypothetical protein
MSDDNVIGMNNDNKTGEISQDVEDRIYDCFHASISFDLTHQKKCIYCMHNNATGQMLFDILARDMTLAAQNKNLILTTFDLRQVIANVLMRVNDAEYEMEKEFTQETGTQRQGENRESSLGREKTEETSSPVTEGVIEINSFRKSPKKN